MVLISQTVHDHVVHSRGNLRTTVHGIEVRKQRNYYPVVVCDVAVTCDDGPHFPGFAAAELQGSVCTNARKVNGSMPRWLERSEEAVRFFQQESGLRIAAPRWREQDCKSHENECGFAWGAQGHCDSWLKVSYLVWIKPKKTKVIPSQK